VRITPGWCPSCAGRCPSSFPAARRTTCPRPRPGRYWPRSGRATPPEKARRRVAAELIADLERNYQRTKAADKELREQLAATGSTLTQLHGIGPSGAARLLVEAVDITRFPSRAHFASWNGTALIDASSGEHVRHRLSRAGNRQINRTLHIMAVVQLRNPTAGRAYYHRKVAAGKTPREAVRALKRQAGQRMGGGARGNRRWPDQGRRRRPAPGRRRRAC
jgi:transposase